MSYSHSAVSQQLAVLEDELGAQLLEPDGRRVRLTVQGEVLVQHVEAILERLDQADADLARAAGRHSWDLQDRDLPDGHDGADAVCAHGPPG